MNKVLGLIVAVLLCVGGIGGSVFAQASDTNSYNLRVQNLQISGMAADSLKSSAWFRVTDFTYIAAIVRTPVDSSAYILGYQRGYIGPDMEVRAQRPIMPIDTLNTNTATFATSGTFLPTASDSDAVKTVDSIGLSPMCSMKRVITPLWSPVARIVCKGVTGNKKTRYNIGVTINQGKYWRSDAGRQPE
jgi:hypothetical protein